MDEISFCLRFKPFQEQSRSIVKGIFRIGNENKVDGKPDRIESTFIVFFIVEHLNFYFFDSKTPPPCKIKRLQTKNKRTTMTGRQAKFSRFSRSTNCVFIVFTENNF